MFTSNVTIDHLLIDGILSVCGGGMRSGSEEAESTEALQTILVHWTSNILGKGFSYIWVQVYAQLHVILLTPYQWKESVGVGRGRWKLRRGWIYRKERKTEN